MRIHTGHSPSGPLRPLTNPSFQRRPSSDACLLCSSRRSSPQHCQAGVDHTQNANGRSPGHRHNLLIFLGNLERAKGFEPSTPTLARLCSTPELRPRSPCAPARNRTRFLGRFPLLCNRWRQGPAVLILARRRCLIVVADPGLDDEGIHAGQNDNCWPRPAREWSRRRNSTA